MSATNQLGDTAAGVIPRQYEDLLKSKAVANVATIGPKKEPQVNPVWFDWDGQRLLFSQTWQRQKLRNIGRDPRIAVSIVDPENHLRYLEIRGVVDTIEDDSDNRFIDSMARKYLGLDIYPWAQPDEQRVIVAVRPVYSTHLG